MLIYRKYGRLKNVNLWLKYASYIESPIYHPFKNKTKCSYHTFITHLKTALSKVELYPKLHIFTLSFTLNYIFSGYSF